MNSGNVFPQIMPLTETEFRLLFGLGAERASRARGLDRLAMWIGSCTKTLTNALAARGTMRADLVLNTIAADTGAFTALWDRLGWEPAPIECAPMPDADTMALLAELLAEYAGAMRDKRIDHVELQLIVEKIRPLLPCFRAMVRASDRLTGATA